MAIDDSRPIPALTPADIDRFWSKVDKSPGNGPHGDCWLWVGGKSDGYGAFYLNGENFGAHRVSLLIKTGEDPREYRSCHTCDFPPCVNPEHLFKGTDTDNRRDAINKALSMASKGDVVVIAGKGHEKYQIIKERSIPFDDCAVARSVLKKII